MAPYSIAPQREIDAPMPDQRIDGRQRVIVARVSPEVECGRFAIKRVVGERVTVEADVFADGHDLVFCQILYKQNGHEFEASPMKSLGNDRWRGEFTVRELGSYSYTVEAWIDRFLTWRRDLEKRISAGQDVSVELLIGAELIERAAARAASRRSSGVNKGVRQEETGVLEKWAKRLRENAGNESGAAIALDPELLKLVQRYPERDFATRYDKQLSIVVEREKARFSTWYELFPRSCSKEPGRHGTFRDCEEWLPYVASMGFDVIYLPPIHPIGKTFRKGKNNSLPAEPDDLGSPWAIGSSEGGHQSIHPNWAHCRISGDSSAKAADHGLEVALDIALPVQPRPSLRARASRMVQHSPRRHHSVCGKSAQEISGHLPILF
jgi:starch synthase (maltosyl-transferring)